MFHFIIDIFEETARRFPDRAAVADEYRTLSFSRLRQTALQAASLIRTDSVRVGVMAHRDAFTIPMFFGVAYSGKCYVPMDPDAPAEKLGKIISDAGITHVLSAHPEDQEKVRLAGAELVCFDPDALNGSEEFCLPGQAVSDLYIIYTSGSTGMPKGIVKSHRAMQSFVEAYIREFGFDETTVIGNQTPFCFDASAKDIYLMAACGASIQILPTKLFSFPVKLVEYMNERKVNFISWVPSALTIVTALNTFSEILPTDLKRVFFVGEVFPAKHLNKWIRALPEAEYVNLYGSSEICGISCFCRIPAEVDEGSSLPIGTALGNCDVRLVSDEGTVTAPGITGEIYVASDALAEGYFGDSEKTAKSFLSADFGDGVKRYYRTGDLARYDEAGRLVFVSRSDYQIKHMGHRIELGEIETAAAAISGVEKCCCLYDSRRSRIILFLQPQAGAEVEGSRVRSALKEKLADYMIPHRVRVLEQLPLNTNGKIDRPTLQKTL